MSSRPVYRTCVQVAPSGEYLRGYKLHAADWSRLAPRVAASCLAKSGCYIWPARRYSLCCSAWQLVCEYVCIVLIYSAAKLQVCFNKLTLLYFASSNEKLL